MTDWIEINLPWQINSYRQPMLPQEDEEAINARGRILFGKTDTEASKSINSLFDKFFEVKANLNDVEKGNNFTADQFEEYVYNLHPEFLPIKEFRLFRREYADWFDKQKESIAHFARIKEYKTIEAQKSFCGRDLNKPGILIELEQDGQIKKMLIGEINSQAGLCGCCGSIQDTDIVKRYKIVWSDET